MKGSEQQAWVVRRARALGFDLCGVATVEEYRAGGQRTPEWLARGYAGEMKYLRDPRRMDPQRVLDDARSIIVCAMNYNTSLPYSTEANPLAEANPAATVKAAEPRGWISRYAWGDDYHAVLGQKLAALVAAMRAEFPEPFEALWYVDTGPVVERAAARAAGLGWLAKNTCLINEELGSWLFLGAIVTTLELPPTVGTAEAPPADLCGNCTMCIDACPTQAIVEPYVLDARRCISYLTIELRGNIPDEFRAPMGRHVFGCDICQDVCPWNRKAPVTQSPHFQPRKVEVGGQKSEAGEKQESLFAPGLKWLAYLTEEEFRKVFSGSAVRRTKWRGLVRNACLALGNTDARPEAGGTTARVTALLERLADSGDAVIAEHARWALDRWTHAG